MICEFTFSGRPIVKKNTKRFYGKSIVYSKKFQSWLKQATLELRSQRQDYNTIDYKVFAAYEFYFKDARSEPDTSNLVEAIPDLLEKEKIIQNDKLIVGFTAIKFIGDENPRSRVTLYKCNNESVKYSWGDFLNNAFY